MRVNACDRMKRSMFAYRQKFGGGVTLPPARIRGTLTVEARVLREVCERVKG